MQTMGTLVNYSSGSRQRFHVSRVKLDVIKIHYLNKGSLNCPLLIIPGIVENKIGFFLFQKPWFISLLKTYIVPMCKCMCAIKNYTRLQQDVTIYVCVKNEAISGTRTHARAHTGTHTYKHTYTHTHSKYWKYIICHSNMHLSYLVRWICIMCH